MQNNENIRLILEDGSEIKGKSFGAARSIAGEVVFNTAMTGYPESLTDPSYKGQILVLTYPLVGNYGVPRDEVINGISRFFESERIQVSGLIISDYSLKYSHWNANQSLSDWLKSFDIPGIYDVDTRALTKQLREKGSMLGKISYNNENIDFYDPNKENLVSEVSTKEKVVYGEGKYKILLVDCGVKYNIIRNFLERDTTVIRVPWNYDYSNEEFDGLFITNGPGDPKSAESTINQLSRHLKTDIPTFGICMGNQLIGLAAGGDTYKLKFGHRSHNQPVIKVNSDKAYITSQNHGYALDNEKMPPDWEPFFLNLNDNTNEGMRHTKKPVFSVQFHPEASSGPTDTGYLFDEFIDVIKQHKNH